MSETGLVRVGAVVILSGPALHRTLQDVLMAIRHRKLSGLSTQTDEALACELHAAMSAGREREMSVPGHSVIDQIELLQPVPKRQPTMPITQEVADQMNVSLRQARRLALKLGGKKIAGRWFVDETALREHIEGRK